MQKLFGTDGIRGKSNVDPMTSELALRLGRTSAYILHKKKRKAKILLGKDTRISSDMLEGALSAGIVSVGVDCLKVGILPTPGIAYLTRILKADAGIVISASHNPFDDNGIKFFGPDGFKLSDATEEKIEEAIFNQIDRKIISYPTGAGIGRMIHVGDAIDKYKQFLKNSVEGLKLDGISILLDCANGATSYIAPEVFKEMGANVFVVNNIPNGININHKCGSLYPEYMKKYMKKYNADIGFCFDGDGDRVIVIDELGNIIDGDYIMTACAKHLKFIGRLKKNILVVTVMSNLGLYFACREAGIEIRETKVGDRYVAEEMLVSGAIIGGEQSGHIIFFEHHTTGDGIMTALQVLKLLRDIDKPASEISKVMKKFPQILVNVEVKEKPPLETIPEIQQIIQEVKDTLKDTGRVVVRYSGTEPKCRVMLEGQDEAQIKTLAQKIADVISKNIGK
jgi:phosphoglucosamine mutase